MLKPSAGQPRARSRTLAHFAETGSAKRWRLEGPLGMKRLMRPPAGVRVSDFAPRPK
jgi:hypothetical protein